MALFDREKWSPAEIDYLRTAWANECPYDEMIRALKRGRRSITDKARELGLDRRRGGAEPQPLETLAGRIDPLVLELERARREQDLPYRDLGVISGAGRHALNSWALAARSPRLDVLQKVATALGYRIVLEKLEEGSVCG